MKKCLLFLFTFMSFSLIATDVMQPENFVDEISNNDAKFERVKADGNTEVYRIEENINGIKIICYGASQKYANVGHAID